jgi:hypothetical protein
MTTSSDDDAYNGQLPTEGPGISHKESLELEKLTLETETLRRSFKPSRWISTPVDALLKLLQSIAILFAAAWGLFLYESFQRTANDQMLKQQDLSNKQAELQLSTLQGQKDLHDIELRNQIALQELSKSQGELALKQSQFSLDQEKATAALKRTEIENSLTLQELQGTLDKTRIEREGLELATAKERGYVCESKVDLLPSQGEIRNLNYAFSCQNVNLPSINATAVVVDYFIGHLDANRLSKEKYALLSGPPGRWSNTRPASTALQWDRVGSWGGFEPNIADRCSRFFQDFVAPGVAFVRSAPGLGEWKQKETFRISSDIAIKASVEEYFGVVFNVSLNNSCGDLSSYDLVTYFNVKSLRPVATPQTPTP